MSRSPPAPSLRLGSSISAIGPGRSTRARGVGREVVDDAVPALARASWRALSRASSASIASSPATSRMSSSAVSASRSSVGERERLLHRAGRVAERRTRRPTTGTRASGGRSAHGAPRAAPVVQEHDVDVGARAQLAARVRAERDQRPTARRARSRVATLGQRRVDARRPSARRTPRPRSAVVGDDPARVAARSRVVDRWRRVRASERVRTGLAGADAVDRSRPGRPTPCRRRSCRCGPSR